MEIIKRDGRLVPFDKSKIEKAVLAAFADVDGSPNKGAEIAAYIADDIEAEALVSEYAFGIEQIQNMVESKLMESDRKDVARAYITYRDKRTRARERTSELMRQIGAKLNATNVVNQNANVDERAFSGRLGEAQSVVAKRYALDNLVSPMARRHHDNNEIYIHDLDSYALGMHNCARGTTWIQLKRGDKVEIRHIEDFANEIGLAQNQTADLSLAGMSILGRDGWTKLQAITRRAPQTDEELFVIKTNLGLPLELTADHRLPVIRDGKEMVLEVRDIAVGDKLLTADQSIGCDVDKNTYIDLTELAKNDSIDLRIANARPLNDYLRYRYGVRLYELCESVQPKPQLNHAQLTVSDFLEIEKEYPIPFDLKMRLLVKASGSKHAYPMLIPVTPSLAKLYGYIYCDGGVYVNDSLSTWQITFTNTNIDLMRDFCACYEEVFGYAPKIHQPSGNSPCYRLTDGSRIVCELFHNFANAYKTNAGNISLPDFIVNGDEPIKYAYISAFIDTDGCMSTDRITFTTCAKTMAEQLMLMLEGLGYHPSIVLTQKKGSTYHFGNSNRNGMRNFDGYAVMLSRSDERKELVANTDTLKTADITAKSGLGHHLIPASIKSIETMPLTEDVYDLQTTTHWFIANNYVSHNCLTLPIDDLLANGFMTRQTDVRPAGSVKSAMQLVAVLFQLQSLCQFGGVAASHLDWSMVPYVRKSFSKHYRDGMRFIAHDLEYERDPDKSISDSTYRRNTDVYEYALAMTKEEVKQATEAMFHNLNTLQSRSGGQLPFSSINFGTCTLPEGRMVIRALLETSLDGLGRLHTTPIFPCSIFKLKTGINRHPGDPNYDLFQLALKSTAKRLYPNYANVDWSGNAGYDPNDPRTEFSTMGCRTANGFDINGFGQLKDGRGNVCPVTIILPTIAMYALDRLEGYENDAVDENTIADVFIDTLDGYISDAKDMLIERFDYITSQSPASAPFMYQNDTMAGYDGKTVLSAMKHGTLAIGQLGLAEALQLLIGCDHTTPRGMALAKRIEQLFKDRCAEYKQAYHMNFGVYFTPAENLCYTAMTKFRDRYGVIPNVSDKDFFTNSTHVPVWVQVDPFTKIDIESQLTGYSSAGCITYVELDTTAQKNLSALETLVNYAMDKDVPYFAINVPNDTCMDCGYTDELGDTCPMCGGTNIQRLRRVTGYLTGNYTTAFNLGKQQEVQMRFQHTKLSPMFHEGANNGFDC